MSAIARSMRFLLAKPKKPKVRKFLVAPRPLLYRIQRELGCRISEELHPHTRSKLFHE